MELVSVGRVAVVPILSRRFTSFHVSLLQFFSFFAGEFFSCLQWLLDAVVSASTDRGRSVSHMSGGG